jgi:hypothetical protein
MGHKQLLSKQYAPVTEHQNRTPVRYRQGQAVGTPLTTINCWSTPSIQDLPTKRNAYLKRTPLYKYIDWALCAYLTLINKSLYHHGFLCDPVTQLAVTLIARSAAPALFSLEVQGGSRAGIVQDSYPRQHTEAKL